MSRSTPRCLHQGPSLIRISQMGAWFSSLSCSVHQCLLPYEGSSHWYIAGTLRFQWIIFSSRLSHSPARSLPLRETSISPGLVTGKLKVVHHFSIMFNSILSRLYVKSPCSCQGIVMLHPGKTHCTARRPSLTYTASVWTVASVPPFGGFPYG